jgi:hypothetical protein
MTERYRAMLTEQAIVTAKTFREDHDVCIYIRNYDRAPKGLCLAKLGVKLSLGQWKQLVGDMKIIDEALADIKKGRDTHYIEQLGSDTYVSVNTAFEGVTIRHWRWNKNSLVPTKRVVYLDSLQWNLLTMCSKDIERAIPEMKHLEYYCNEYHNETRGLTCQ